MVSPRIGVICWSVDWFVLISIRIDFFFWIWNCCFTIMLILLFMSFFLFVCFVVGRWCFWRTVINSQEIWRYAYKEMGTSPEEVNIWSAITTNPPNQSKQKKITNWAINEMILGLIGDIKKKERKQESKKARKRWLLDQKHQPLIVDIWAFRHYLIGWSIHTKKQTKTPHEWINEWWMIGGFHRIEKKKRTMKGKRVWLPQHQRNLLWSILSPTNCEHNQDISFNTFIDGVSVVNVMNGGLMVCLNWFGMRQAFT